MISPAEYYVSNNKKFALALVKRYNGKPKDEAELTRMFHKVMMSGKEDVLREIANNHPDIEFVKAMSDDEEASSSCSGSCGCQEKKSGCCGSSFSGHPFNAYSYMNAVGPQPESQPVKTQSSESNNIGLFILGAIAILALMK